MADPFLSQISLFGCNYAPNGWAFCEGQVQAITQNQALYSLMGTAYGGDGRTSFALPDYRKRIPIGEGTSDYGYPRTRGQKGGFDSVTLSMNTMPVHTHDAIVNATTTGSIVGNPTANASVKCNNTAITSPDPKENVWGKLSGDGIYDNAPGDSDIMHGGAIEVSVDLSPVSVDLNIEIDTVTVDSAGGNQAHENRPPMLAVSYCIALVGVYPSRN